MAYRVNKTAIIRADELRKNYPELISWWCEAIGEPFMVNDCYVVSYFKIHELSRGYLIEFPGFKVGRNTTVFANVVEIPYKHYHLVSHLFR